MLDGRGKDVRVTMALAVEAQQAALEGDTATVNRIAPEIAGAPTAAIVNLQTAQRVHQAVAAGDTAEAARLSKMLPDFLRERAAELYDLRPGSGSAMTILGREIPFWVLAGGAGAVALGTILLTLLLSRRSP